MIQSVSAQDKKVGIDILKRMSSIQAEEEFDLFDEEWDDESRWERQRQRQRQRQRDFLADVAFEYHDRDAVEVVKNVFSVMTSLVIGEETSAHTLAGYKFVKPDFIQNLAMLTVCRDCTLMLSTELAEVICTSTSLKIVSLEYCTLSDNFYTILASNGQGTMVQSVTLNEIDLGSSDSAAKDLARWLCSSNVKHITLKKQNSANLGAFMPMGNMPDSFFQQLALEASTRMVYRQSPNDSVSEHQTTGLTNPGLDKVDVRASSATKAPIKPQIQSLTLSDMYLSYQASRDLATAICLLPDLSQLNMGDGHFPIHINKVFKDTIAQMKADYEECLPHMSKGDFKFNRRTYSHLDSFIQALQEDDRVRFRDIDEEENDDDDDDNDDDDGDQFVEFGLPDQEMNATTETERPGWHSQQPWSSVAQMGGETEPPPNEVQQRDTSWSDQPTRSESQGFCTVG